MTIVQWIGTDGEYLYDMSRQANVYDDEDPVLQLSVVRTRIGDREPRWETLFYRNWQRGSVVEMEELARPFVDLALRDLPAFVAAHRGTDESETS
jgi:hypothetical protein